jgi:hypothetical protein
MKIKFKGIISSRRVWLNEEELSPSESQKLRNHSPDGFSWSYSGSGPSQLALAICLKIYSKDIALKVYREFRDKYIATLPSTDFEVEIEA